ncbi:hypothetical protein NNC19_09775 [Clostridium sp. SHJSY1]|uniref:hypothetical protein n=1 Tax=Clostridium sp. SHJSY1 TaxID=2942483 RepID=UPI0028755E2E|nr:hypothetical protein [Clostridium sp. SHJSY1]MDS0525966.1 hypothetical protein [Clostridium sp. SHJSY1]
MKNMKAIASIISLIVIGIILFFGYTTLKKHYTPENAVKEYCNYLANKEYPKAYKILFNTDNDFLSEEIFEGSLKNVDFNGYFIKQTNENTYEIQVNGQTYKAEIRERGKKFFLFPDYKINADNLVVKNWDFNLPKGSEVYINNKKVNMIIGYGDNVKSLGNVYYPEVNRYSINYIFKGNYDVTFKLDGAEDIVNSNVEAGSQINQNLNMKSEVKEQLKTHTIDFLKSVYTEGDYKQYLTSDNDIFNMNEYTSNYMSLNSSLHNFIGDKIELIERETALDDINHARICITYKLKEKPPYLTTNKIVTKKCTFYFRKDNDKWDICGGNENWEK